jgi:hypothetical protein
VRYAAKQKPRRPGIAPALGLRAGEVLDPAPQTLQRSNR